MQLSFLSEPALSEISASPLRYLRPIHSEEDYEVVMEGISALMNAPDDTPMAQILEVLTVLAHEWEQKHHAIPDADPIEVLKFVMEQRGLTPQALEPFIGSRGRVWEILNGKRSLSLSMISKLSAGLHIPAEALLPRTPLIAQHLFEVSILDPGAAQQKPWGDLIGRAIASALPERDAVLFSTDIRRGRCFFSFQIGGDGPEILLGTLRAALSQAVAPMLEVQVVQRQLS